AGRPAWNIIRPAIEAAVSLTNFRRFITSPHLAAAVGGPDHRFAGFAAEGHPKFFQIGKRAIDTKTRKRVRVAQGLLTLGFVALAHGPNHSPSDEEPLLGRETID